MHRTRTLATTALAAIITLTTVAASNAGEVTVLWTAPGGDGYSGRASRYDLRYSSQPLTDGNFAQATAVSGVPTPGAAGAAQACTITGLQEGVTYYFAIKTVDAAGNWSPLSNVLSGEVPEVSNQLESAEVSFSAPRPNPAREQSSFRCTLPEAAPVQVEVFDIMGRCVRVLARQDLAAGIVDLPFDLRDDGGARLARGVYLVRARLGTAVFTRRLVVVK